MFTNRTRIAAALVAAGLLVAGAGCAPPSSSSSSKSEGATTWDSAKAAGGMDKLVAAAKKEGQLNVIALPPDWSNYGNIIKGFTKKYGIKVNSAQPNAASQDEINAAKQLKGTKRAPDVFDLSQTVALANTAMYAKYKVATWDTVGDDFKDPDGLWTNDYTGIMSVGYDSSKVPDVTGVKDLLGSKYKGKVALNGDPTQAGAAFAGVMMVSIVEGGSADDIQPGVDFFKKLKKAGNFLPVDPTPATIESGQTPVVIDWNYNNASQAKKLKSWKTFVPKNAKVGSYYYQAINKDSPHPAVARLWQEYLFSDAGQNLYLEGFATPVRADDMKTKGTINKAALAKVSTSPGKPVVLTPEQNTKAAAVLTKEWKNVTG